MGGYWTGSDQWGSATVYFVTPTDFHWWQLYAPAMDTCRTDTYKDSTEIYLLEPNASSITLSSTSGTPITLNWDDEFGGYVDDELTAAQWVDNGWYSMEIAGSDYLPDMTAPDFMRASSTMNVISPAISGSTAPRISRAQTFTWNADSADWIMIMLGLTNSTGTGYEQFIYCVANNDGSFNVDSSQWSSWTTNRQVDVYFGRVTESGDTLPHNNSQSRVNGTYFMVGAGFSQ